MADHWIWLSAGQLKVVSLCHVLIYRKGGRGSIFSPFVISLRTFSKYEGFNLECIASKQN
jgi:hypothetical protein